MELMELEETVKELAPLRAQLEGVMAGLSASTLRQAVIFGHFAGVPLERMVELLKSEHKAFSAIAALGVPAAPREEAPGPEVGVVDRDVAGAVGQPLVVAPPVQKEPSRELTRAQSALNHHKASCDACRGGMDCSEVGALRNALAEASK